jgi:phospholipid/cholesterol/gamma-HCH transport system ATP-binding protein
MIARARREFDFTAIIVTHDLPEALIACDRVALLDEGRIRFNGTPAEFAATLDPVVSGLRDGAAALARQIEALRRSAVTFVVPSLTPNENVPS